MNHLQNQGIGLIKRTGKAWCLAAAIAACGISAVAQRAPAQSSDKNIFDFDDDPKGQTNKPKTPATTPPATTPPATTPPSTTPPSTTPPATTPPANDPPAVTPPPVAPPPAVTTAPPKKVSATVTTVKGPPTKLAAPAAVEKVSLGLIAETFSGAAFQKMTGSRTTPRVNAKITPKPDSPAPENGVLPVSIRWRGLVRAPQAGVYKFRLVAPAQSTVRIGGEAVFWGGPAPATAFASRSVELQDGAYPLVIETSNIASGEEVRLTLEWMLVSGFDWETVPASALCRVSTNGTGVAPNSTAINKPKPPAGPAGPVPLVKGTAKVPDEPTQAEVKKRIRAAHAAEFADQRPLAKLALAKALRAQAAQATSIPDQYVMLKESAEQFAAAGDIPAAMDVVRTAVAAYDIDEAAFAVSAFGTIAAKSSRPADQADALGLALIGVAERTLAGGSTDAACRAADLAVAAARPSTGGTLRVKPRADRIKECRTELQRLTVYANKLKANATDPEPNMRLGKFHALLAGNWDVGLPMLAKGSDSELKLIAEMEVSKPADRTSQLKLADAWWDRSQTEKEPYATAARSRASAWYALLMPSENNETEKQKMSDRMVAAAEPINLIALVDLRRDAIRGQWRYAGRDILCEGRGNCALQIPFAPKGDYDFGIEFTVTAGDINVSQILPGAASNFNWRMYTYGMMFEYESAPFLGVNGSSMSRATGITGKQRHVSVIRVRGNNIKVFVDGQLAAEWSTDATKVKGVKDWQLADVSMLGIGCKESQIVVHAAKLVELSGQH